MPPSDPHVAADLIDANIIFAGSAEDVGDPNIEFSDQIGGIGTILMMGHGAPT